MFRSLMHADWSVGRNKRWSAYARYEKGGWIVTELRVVDASPVLLDWLFEQAAALPVLAGFDFPIGLPRRYGESTGFDGFCEALACFGEGLWSRFYDVADRPDEISTRRPFYPRRSTSEARQAHLLKALAVQHINDLRRQCELGTKERGAAFPVFWTLGGNQVGKAAITGWREIISPAIKRGAKLWPFDGDLTSLGKTPGLVLAETYPAEAYGHIGVVFRRNESKRRNSDRLRFAEAITGWIKRRDVRFEPKVEELVRNGFGMDGSGEDRFDALMGLLGMIEVVLGKRPEGSLNNRTNVPWEGWILGQAS